MHPEAESVPDAQDLRVRPLQGATNFRDLGGYLGEGGRPVRWGRIFRSDHLAGLTAADGAQLQALGLRRAIDFRGRQEAAEQGYRWPWLQQHHLSIEPSVAQRMEALRASGEPLTPEHMVELMAELYQRLVDEHAHRFAQLFEHLLAEDDDSPLVFHCTAGKDRTGLAAAFILLALGVSREDVERDYLLTNQVYRHPPLVGARLPPEVLQVLWGVRLDFLHAAFETLDRHHGGFERYLAERIGLDDARRAALRARYLQPG
jgi:protein-tyrosine phosphatase